MADDGEKTDFYAVLGLQKNCSSSELKYAYKKLALKWHPDRFLASGNSKNVEESKKNFQAIQEAYSVLSDEGKRFMYDIGIYNADDDDENDMGDFLGELSAMMNQTKPCEKGQQSFEELQNLFQEMFQPNEQQCFNPTPHSSFMNHASNNINSTFSYSYSNDFSSNKKTCSSISSEQTKLDFTMESFDFSSFSMGAESDAGSSKGRGGTVKRTRGKQKVSSRRDMSSSHDSNKVLV
ncbi:hypothetical protein ACHQM5_029296 [Ranunculus cassubicifolius]